MRNLENEDAYGIHNWTDRFLETPASKDEEKTNNFKKLKKKLSLKKHFGNNSQSQRGYVHLICSCQFYFLTFFFESFTNPESSNASKENCLIGLRCDMAGKPMIDLFILPLLGPLKLQNQTALNRTH